MKQYKPLTIKYIGKKGGEIDLVIDSFPDDQELIIAMQDPDYQEEWKIELLDSYYYESLNDKKESRRDRHSQLSTFAYEDVRFFGITDDVDEKLITEEFFEEISKVLNERQLYLVKRCLIGGESYSQVAREEGKDESAIRKAVDRAKKKLKKFFEEDRPN